MGAKYSHKVWKQFAHTFEKSDSRPRMYISMQDLYATIVCSNLCFLLCLKHSATGKMTRPTIVSFCGFHEKVTLTCATSGIGGDPCIGN